MNIGKSLAIAMASREISVAEMAKCLDMTPGHLSKIKNNRVKQINQETLSRMAGATGYRVSEFIALGEVSHSGQIKEY